MKSGMDSMRDIVKQVIDYIENNLEKELDLDMIAESAGYSKFHLNRIFTNETGCTIYKYIQTRRLTIAAEKLVKTDLPVSRIACEALYNSQQAFSLAFKQVYLYPPRVYRDKGIFMPKQNRISMYRHLDRRLFQNTIYKTGRMAA